MNIGKLNFILIFNRSKDIVEPMIKPQWYVSCSDMAAEAIKVVKSKELKIIPEQFEKTWFFWMEGIRDWCILYFVCFSLCSCIANRKKGILSCPTRLSYSNIPRTEKNTIAMC